MRKQERRNTVYVGFIDLEKAYDRVNMEALWRVLRMYDVGSILFSGIKSMYADSLACVRVKGGESEQFKIVGSDRGVSYLLGCSMYMWME